MKNTIIILVLLIISGCNSPPEKNQESNYDLAIEKLSITTQELEAISKEKDLYVKVLDDFEKQKSEYGYLFNSQQISDEMQNLSDWHYDISRREKVISFQHDLNIYDAHIQAEKKHTDSNDIPLRNSSTGKP
jgi:hypothetical protein